MPVKNDKQVIIDTLMAFIIASVEPKELMLDLCGVADGDVTPDEFWHKWETILDNLKDSTDCGPLRASLIPTTEV